VVEVMVISYHTTTTTTTTPTPTATPPPHLVDDLLQTLVSHSHGIGLLGDQDEDTPFSINGEVEGDQRAQVVVTGFDQWGVVLRLLFKQVHDTIMIYR